MVTVAPAQATANVAPVSNCRLVNFEDNEYQPEYTTVLRPTITVALSKRSAITVAAAKSAAETSSAALFCSPADSAPQQNTRRPG